MEAGIILLWSGAIVDIPAGWVICDGNNGTPDLRNRFIVGAGDTYDPADNAAAPTHTHTFTANIHTHSPVGGAPLELKGAGADGHVSSKFVTGTTDTSTALPPYYALAYIMKT